MNRRNILIPLLALLMLILSMLACVDLPDCHSDECVYRGCAACQDYSR